MIKIKEIWRGVLAIDPTYVVAWRVGILLLSHDAMVRFVDRISCLWDFIGVLTSKNSEGYYDHIFPRKISLVPIVHVISCQQLQLESLRAAIMSQAGLILPTDAAQSPCYILSVWGRHFFLFIFIFYAQYMACYWKVWVRTFYFPKMSL